MSAALDLAILQYLTYNVFLPPKLPQEEQKESFQVSVDLAIIRSVIQAGQQYGNKTQSGAQWNPINLMLQRLYDYVETSIKKDQLGEDMENMKPGDVLSLYIKAQNAGLIIRKQFQHTTFEVFEAQAQAEDVMSTPGKIVRKFPGPMVQIPNLVANDRNFIDEVANILEQMNSEVFDEAHPKSRKAGTDARETRDSINPNYFIQFFFGFLRGMGALVDSPRIVKRVGDEVLWMDAKNPWRRSPIWLIIRVALQTSLDSKTTYKQFMVYHHASILSQCGQHDSFPSDLLYAMRVKMARRLYKLTDTAPQFLIDTTKSAANKIQDVLQARWSAVQSAQAQSPNADFSHVDFKPAIHQTLPHSRSYLEQVFQRCSSHKRPSNFIPKHSPRLENIAEFSRYANGGLSRAFTSDPHLALFDFEASIFANLTIWTSKQWDFAGACATMSSCFRQYIESAKSYYTADVADRSIMILILVRIWMAIDELATQSCPLLCKFSPELPEDILDPLLLRTTQHIEQARIIQEYIHERNTDASASNPSVFSDEVTSTSFAVQYFRASWGLQQIKSAIETHAQEQKNHKIKELEEVNTKYEQLTEVLRGKTCEYRYTPTGKRKHVNGCARCCIEKARNALQIQPYEWPLPPEELHAKAVVFELERPGAFSVWRDITYEILVDLGTLSPRGKCNQYVILEGYKPLGPWLSTPTSIPPRITIASSTKSFRQSHYGRTISLPALQYQVCLDNALQFSLYDKDGGAWATGPFPGVSFAQYGTLKLPANSLYKHLEYAVEGTTHSSNQVIADQHDCPKALSLHEHIAFGTVRSGARLQWMNIVRGLEEDLLNFSADEVRSLHTQAAWQIGPLMDDGSWEWHEELGRLEFGWLLVTQCRRVLDRVRANWLQATSVSILVMLVTRLLASYPSKDVVLFACDFLREARTVAHSWLNQLNSKLQSATAEKDIIGYQNRVCEMATICRATYDVEPHYMNRLLLTPDDFAPLIKASVSLYDNHPPNVKGSPVGLQMLLCRDRRFAHKILPYMLASLHRNDIISIPLSEIWPDYRLGRSEWRASAGPNSRWVTSITARTNRDRTQEVYLNLLSGQLLIDGKPLGRLPREYVQHPTYIRLFGQKILDVVPAKFPGMDFATRDRIHDYQVSFALELDSYRLIIQARKNDRIYELIPHENLSEDFPLFFSKDFHHWANIKNKTVEFRSISSPWSDSSYDWILWFDSSWVLEHSKDRSCLVNVHSRAFETISHTLCPLENSRYLHITRSIRGLVNVELPRMKLSFLVNEDKQLESQNFRDQVVDENQSAGTLFGLKNQLLLRNKRPLARSLPRSRSLLIPDGEINFMMHGQRVSVSIQCDSRCTVDVYRYKIDEDLGYLATDAGLTSRLFKIYLHALTSHCLPDPLTRRTGTEEALHELSQASSWSFEQINVKQAGLLKGIGLLTPKREYYPKHLKCMQTTHWVGLPPLSQHVGFSLAAAAILRRADVLQLFHELEFNIHDYIASLERSDLLLKRATRQTTMYYPPSSTGDASRIMGSATILDHDCPGRDSLAGEWAIAGQAARWASGMVYQHWGNSVFKPYNLVSLVESWRTLDDFQEQNCLGYHPSWFSFKLQSSWVTFYNLLRRVKASGNLYMLASCISSIAFGQTVPTDLIPVFLAFAINQEFEDLNPPPQTSFQFADGYEPTRRKVEELVSEAAYSIDTSPASSFHQEEDESYYEFHDRKRSYHNKYSLIYQSQLVDSLMDQWILMRQQPSLQLIMTNPTHSRWINIRLCLKSTCNYFSSCIWNVKIRNHLRQLEGVLSSRPTSAGTAFLPRDERQTQPPIISLVLADPWSQLSFHGLMKSRFSPPTANVSFLPKYSAANPVEPAIDTSDLASLFAELQKSPNPLNRRYGANLDKSRRELDTEASKSTEQLPRAAILHQTRKCCSSYLGETFQQLDSALSPRTSAEKIISISGVWLRVTPRALLQRLSIQNRSNMHSLPEWRRAVIRYARVFAEYQRSQRLIALEDSRNVEELHKELDFTHGGDPWVDNPDWLLAQIDGDFAARPVQCQVAREMISPSSGSNTVLQLNMGEGKSSVIVPIVVSSLADSSRLVRVIVLKPLWRQMFDLLVSRLSGISNRRIYYLPFGRHIKLDASAAQALRNLYEECMREGGILLAQPEHILSFKLMGIDRLISPTSASDAAISNTLRDIQKWLNANSRDILDESDEILHVRYQLVYTAGEQQQLEGYPDRWTTTQQLLRLAATHIQRLQQEHPDSMLHRQNDHGQFPTLRILPDCTAQVEKKLIVAIAADVREGRILNLNCDCLHPSVRDILPGFFANDDLTYTQYEDLRSKCDSTLWKGLLLVRGLLASGILAFALKRKHYRVDYGLDPNRSLLAIPYRAKDLPSPRAEFGHPDVAIILTCLSYYYQGLTQPQLDLCFELLYKLDDPALEYEYDLKQLNGVNTKDRQQFTERLVPTFSHNSATVDFFLSSVVFPKEAKEFPEKLATSGWDLAERKTNVTTGFSGTNDNQFLLPTSITQADPVKQFNTNALVLTYLLRPENNYYVRMHDRNGISLATKGFIKLLVEQTPEVRVLLDVGAQMLELKNEDLVRYWLRLLRSQPDVEAAVYFNEQDELMVLPRGSAPVPLKSSPFAQQLDKCIVYLDDGHTRGTDLKLSSNARALVTLGPKVTKDRLLQGCMRMRKLGHGQSVIFAAPPEIDIQIRNASPNPIHPQADVGALDVLGWAMLETCKDLNHHVSHWARQGIEFGRRQEAESEYEATGNLSMLTNGWTTPESRPLEDMYGVLSPKALHNTASFTQRAFDVPDLRGRLQDLGVKKLEDTSMDEEQEREVNHEVEREPEVQRPSKEEPMSPAIHPDVRRFIRTGTLPKDQSGILPLFSPLHGYGSRVSKGWSPLLFASADFLQTISRFPTNRLSDFMRPVNWIVNAPANVRVVLSPHEVNELLPLIRKSIVVQLHIYAPRVSLSIRSFSGLQFYSIPTPLTPPTDGISAAQLQLDLFSGQLYFSSYQEYTTLCAILGLHIGSSNEDPDVEIESDGFLNPKHRDRLMHRCPEYSNCEFKASPIPALKDLIGLRRKGTKYLLTHTGRVLYARSMVPEDF